MGWVWKERQSWRGSYRDEAGKQHTKQSIADGTDVTNEDDFVGRKLVEAQGHIKSQTMEGRKAAAKKPGAAKKKEPATGRAKKPATRKAAAKKSTPKDT